MTTMNRFEELIQQYCPDGVVFVPLGSIADLFRGKVISKDYIKDNEGEFPVYSSQSANDGVLGRIDTYMYDGDYLTWTTDGAYAGTVFRRSGKFNITNVCGLVSVINPDVKLDFLYYWLVVEAPKYVYSGMGNPKLMSNVMGTISVPIPPLPVQEEIVRVLDTFRELQAELQAELQNRVLQFNYYRDRLLSFEGRDDVQWMSFADVFETITDFTAAGSFKDIANNVKYLKVPDYAMLIRTTDLKSKFSKGDFIYVSQSAYEYLWRVKINKECIVMPNVGNCGEIYYVVPQDLPYDHCALAPNAIFVRSNTQNNKFLSYCLQVEHFQKQLAKITSPAGQSKFNKTDLKKLILPIPPLSVQEEIVSILDVFDTLATNQAQGLPAEIEKRRQQYEYYRDKLLTFKRKEA